MDNVQERLAAMDEHYKQASADPAGNFELPEDGDYQAVIERFDFPEINGVLYLKTFYVIHHDPKYEGRKVDTIHNLEDPDRIEWAKKHLTTLGYEGSLGDLITGLGPIIGTPVELTIKTSSKTDKEGRPYRNVYCNKRLGPPISDVPSDPSDFATSAPAAAATKSPDDIPF